MALSTSHIIIGQATVQHAFRHVSQRIKGRRDRLSCVFAETAALFAIYLMPCLFFVARIDWVNSRSVAMRVIYLGLAAGSVALLIYLGLAGSVALSKRFSNNALQCTCLVVWSLQDASLGATAEALHSCSCSCFAPPPALAPPAASAPVAPVEPAGLQKPCTAPLLLLLLLNDRAPMPATCSVTCCPIKLNFSGKSKSYNTLK